jgi:hypothetical protein
MPVSTLEYATPCAASAVALAAAIDSRRNVYSLRVRNSSTSRTAPDSGPEARSRNAGVSSRVHSRVAAVLRLCSSSPSRRARAISGLSGIGPVLRRAARSTGAIVCSSQRRLATTSSP